MLRDKASKGGSASWFKKIEEKLLEDMNTRKLKDQFMMTKMNNEVLEIIIDRFVKNSRRRD